MLICSNSPTSQWPCDYATHIQRQLYHENWMQFYETPYHLQSAQWGITIIPRSNYLLRWFCQRDPSMAIVYIVEIWTIAWLDLIVTSCTPPPPLPQKSPRNGKVFWWKHIMLPRHISSKRCGKRGLLTGKLNIMFELKIPLRYRAQTNKGNEITWMSWVNATHAYLNCEKI